MTNWNALITDIVRGDWDNPQTGMPVKLPFETIRLEESLDGGAEDMVGPLNIGRRIAVVSDVNTHEAMGKRVGKELKGLGSIDEIVLPGDTHCDEATINTLQELTRHADGVVAVGSGSVCDVVKYATFKDGRKYAAFGTASSMNGYAAATASVTLRNGYKTSVPAHAPRGVFIDLKVCAAAPTWLSAAGLGDSLCRPTAQVEWWAAHRLLGTPYTETPFSLLKDDEPLMITSAPQLFQHSVAANGHLQRVMILSGFGNNIIGSSHSGSMGEHQVSHWIDMFAGAAHPGTTHGQQVGVASLALARLHHEILELDKPPKIRATHIVESEFITRYGYDLGSMCYAEAKKKSFDASGAAAFNETLSRIWPELRHEMKAFVMDPAVMAATIKAAGGPTTATELGLSVKLWRQAMKHARDVRNRWSFLDLADDAGLLDEFLARDPQ
jgi:glycerol-1-phosphate dehydrogenase [NAD(P)+]